MPLSAGTKLGRYEIISAIGAGGMGEVYKAHDTSLRRTVAIKVLPTSSAIDPSMRARFEQEARTISQLSHAHICAVYDVGESDSIHYLVMELLEGETLSARLNKGPMPVDLVLEYAIQIADALDKAHRRGIIHRDLKPANVMITKSGAKLLDFGLAKLTVKPAITSLETASNPTVEPSTVQGMLLGTFQYMAPEQVEGRTADARSDIWAFGCVLYEMLTGQRTFNSKTQASLIAGILEREPTPVSDLRPMTPPALSRVVRICLAKDPDDRFQSAHDLLLQLKWIAEGGSAAGVAPPVAALRRHRENAVWTAVAAAAALATGLAVWFLKPDAQPESVVTRFAYSLPPDQNFTAFRRQLHAISPDGTRVAYVANSQIYLREMNDLAAKPLPGTNQNPMVPVFSPDGQWIAYFAAATEQDKPVLMKVAVGGGAPIKLANTGWPGGAHWRNGLIVWTENDGDERGIRSVADSGGAPAVFAAIAASEEAKDPFLLDGGDHVMFTVHATGTTPDDAVIVVQKRGETTRATVVTRGMSARVIGGEWLVYQAASNLFALPFDPARRTTSGAAVPVADGVGTTLFGTGRFDVSENGTLVYERAGKAQSSDRQMVWVSRSGAEEEITPRPRPFRHPRLSPDGSRIVVAISGDRPRQTHLWVWDVARRTLSPLTSGQSDDDFPVWTHDGRYVIYAAWAADGSRAFWRIRADGSAPPEKVMDTEGENTAPESITPDGATLIYRTVSSEAGGRDVVSVRLPVTGPPQPVLNSPAVELNGEVSPDGRWIAYESSESGQREIFVRPYPNVNAGRWQVSSGTLAAECPFWAASSKELFYVQRNGKMMAVSVLRGPESVNPFSAPVPLFDRAPYWTAESPGVHTDVSRDGQRFVMLRRPPEQINPERPALIVVTHWLDELRRRVKTKD